MKLCLGTVQFGLEYGVASKGRPDFNESVQIIETAFENGVTAFDTAAAYGNAEEILGEFIKNHKSDRSKFEVATKIPANAFDGVSKENYYDVCTKALNGSLKRLNCDLADYYLMHNPSHVFDADIRAAMHKLALNGLIKKAGVSIYSPNEAMAAVESAEMECLQIPYNVLDKRLDNAGFFNANKSVKKTVFCRSVLLQGLLAMDINKLPNNLIEAQPYLEEYEAICKKYGMSKIEAATAYVIAKQGIDYFIIGVDNKTQLFEQIRLIKNPIPPECFSEIENSFFKVEERILNPGMWKK